MLRKKIIVCYVLTFLLFSAFLCGEFAPLSAIAEDVSSDMEGELVEKREIPEVEQSTGDSELVGLTTRKSPLANVVESGSTESEGFHVAAPIVLPTENETVIERTFDPSLYPSFQSKDDLDAPKEEPTTVEVWTDILDEGFEGAFPSGLWSVYGNPTWDDDNCLPYVGGWSLWCANGGSLGVDPCFNNYPNNMDAWAIYGPFSLSDAVDAYWSFYHWTVTEYNFDYFSYMVSTNGTNFYGYSFTGSSGGWLNRVIDLTNVPTLGNVCGQPQVWVAFIFTSDNIITEQGTFVDQVRIRKDVPPQLDLVMEDVYMRDQPGDAGNIVTQPCVGDQVYIHYRYRCDGAGTTPAFRRENRIDGSVECYSSSVTATGGYTYTVWCTSPWTVTSGTHTIEAEADVYNTVTEPNEFNNDDSYTFTADPCVQQDLVMEDVYMRDQPGDAGNIVTQPCVGDQVYIHYRYRCDGTGTTPAFRRENRIDGSVECYSSSVTATGGSTYTVWCTSPWTATVGTHTIEAEVDVYNTVTEPNEFNNDDSYTFTAAICDECIVLCDEDESGTLNIVDTCGTSGSQVTVTVEVNSASNMVDSLGFEVTYNSDNCLDYTGFMRGDLTVGFDFFDCTEPGPGVVRCGGFDSGADAISPGASGSVVDLTFNIITPDLDEPGEAVKLDLQELVDDVSGWLTSPGYICGCSCICDVSGDGQCTPQDALCSFQVYLGVCPTTCGLCEYICCDVTGEDQCTPADALCRFQEYLGIHPNCFD